MFLQDRPCQPQEARFRVASPGVFLAAAFIEVSRLAGGDDRRSLTSAGRLGAFPRTTVARASGRRLRKGAELAGDDRSLSSPLPRPALGVHPVREGAEPRDGSLS